MCEPAPWWIYALLGMAGGLLFFLVAAAWSFACRQAREGGDVQR